MDDATLTIRVAEYLALIPTFAWHEGAYTAGEIGIFYGAIPATVDRAIGLRVYGRFEVDGARARRLQVRLRGTPGDVTGADRLAEPVETHLTNLSRWGGISGIRHESMASLGADKNGREERSDNYIIILDNLEASS